MKLSRFALVHVACVAVLFAGVRLGFGLGPGTAFLVGSFLMSGSLLATGIAWSNILRKKSIALSISVIVFKYAILAAIVFYFCTHYPRITLWFMLGVAELSVSALAAAVFNSERKDFWRTSIG